MSVKMFITSYFVGLAVCTSPSYTGRQFTDDAAVEAMLGETLATHEGPGLAHMAKVKASPSTLSYPASDLEDYDPSASGTPSHIDAEYYVGAVSSSSDAIVASQADAEPIAGLIASPKKLPEAPGTPTKTGNEPEEKPVHLEDAEGKSLQLAMLEEGDNEMKFDVRITKKEEPLECSLLGCKRPLGPKGGRNAKRPSDGVPTSSYLLGDYTQSGPTNTTPYPM